MMSKNVDFGETFVPIPSHFLHTFKFAHNAFRSDLIGDHALKLPLCDSKDISYFVYQYSFAAYKALTRNSHLHSI